MRCFSSPGLPPTWLDNHLVMIGLSHSEIRGSIRICQSPRLFAAYHVLLRLERAQAFTVRSYLLSLLDRFSYLIRFFSICCFFRSNTSYMYSSFVVSQNVKELFYESSAFLCHLIHVWYKGNRTPLKKFQVPSSKLRCAKWLFVSRRGLTWIFVLKLYVLYTMCTNIKLLLLILLLMIAKWCRLTDLSSFNSSINYKS